MVTLEDVQAAQKRIAGVIAKTPLIQYTDAVTKKLTFPKPENFQPVGTFKLRGAYNKIASLSPRERAKGVIAFSSGNHAQGVAYAARALGSRAVIVMPAKAPAIKKAKTLELGADAAIDPTDGDLEEQVMVHTGGRGATLILECSGSDAGRAGTVDVVATRGRIVLILSLIHI